MPLKDLKVGQKITLPDIFDPVTGKGNETVEVLDKTEMVFNGNETQAWKVKVTYGNLQQAMWVDGEGRLLEGTLPLGITVIRADKTKIAREISGSRRDSRPDVLIGSAYPRVNFREPVNLRMLKSSNYCPATQHPLLRLSGRHTRTALSP